MNAPTQPTIVTNAGPVIVLGKLNRLDLLAQVFSVVHMPAAVYREVIGQGLQRGEPDAARVRRFWRQQAWPIVPAREEWRDTLQFAVSLGQGEQEVLTFAAHSMPALVLMDDAAARAEARGLQIPARGTLGVIAEAVIRQAIELRDAEALIEEIAADTSIWISPTLCRAVVQRLRERSALDAQDR